ncbi:hypothetical protein [Vibrio coralliilyticus]|uniref:Bacteriocin n=1 Tax=Vibrio coralliilyticus TaxID=190893 RepID=A0AAP7DD76_9VIBR|nr:hypothetical protein [Vibrio coralliilyticus]NOJ22747.1 hypothetical protein [Vibrio coralliilyticus]NRF62590.1 hypothetical protein [Vibrio coralliilyticus]
MYNLSVDEISMVDGGGDGNSSGYPASPSAVKQQSGPQGDWGRGVLCGMAVGAAGGAAGAAVKGIGAAAGIGAGAGFGSGVCGA